MNRGFIGALCLSVAFVLLGGCGGSQPATATPGMISQASAIATHPAGGNSWMPETSGEDLMYVSDAKNEVRIFSYPAGKPIEEFTLDSAGSSCAGTNGNIYISGLNNISEYAHGGTVPLTTLPIGSPVRTCAVDPATGDLAATISAGSKSYIALFPNGTGTPEKIQDPGLESYFGCTYDSDGNLFVDGETRNSAPFLAELPRGASQFTNFSLGSVGAGFWIQWDGTAIAMEDFGQHGGNSGHITRLQVSGSSIQVIGTVSLIGKLSIAQPWLQGGTFIASIYERRRAHRHDVKPLHRSSFNKATALAFWDYPNGGKETQTIPWTEFNRKAGIRAITISVSPTN